MILLSSIIQTFEADFLARYQNSMLPSHRKALAAMKQCRTTQSPMMLAQCDRCDRQKLTPHSCGHRHCPHCQHHESQQWIKRQCQKQLPAEYFLVTFTLPGEFRPLAWQQQRIVYDAMIRCSWETLNTFTQNDHQLQGNAGAIAVIHTHSRRLEYHPHVHCLMPAAAINPKKRLWRTKKKRRNNKTGYLFNHQALAKVFRAKMLEAIKQAALELPVRYPETWIADVKSVGQGDTALVYLGRYLYKGVIQENDIIACQNGEVTFRYRDSKTQHLCTRTLSGAKFLWLMLQHVLPKGFRRARNFGFLHPNSKRLIRLLQYLLKLHPNPFLSHFKQRPQLVCKGCGGVMRIVKTRIPSEFSFRRVISTG